MNIRTILTAITRQNNIKFVGSYPNGYKEKWGSKGFFVLTLLMGVLGPICAFALDFQLPTTRLLPEDAPRGVLKYDIDGDSLIDVGFAMTGVSGGQTAVVIFLSDGNGGVKQEIETAQNLGARGFTAGLINGDTIPDLVLAAPNNATLYILLGNAQGGFSRDPALDIPIVGADPGIVRVADLDGQGGLDLVIGDILATGSGLFTALGNNDGTFSTPVGIVGSQGIAAGDLHLGDFDHDGNLDIATPAQIFLGAGNGSFPGNPINLSGGQALAAGDLDGDGDQDLAVMDQDTLTIYVGDNQGGFSFNSRLPQPGALFRDLEVLDIDLDGLNDLVLTDENSDAIFYFLGQGNAAFAAPISVLTPQAPYSLAVLDLNNDRFPDIVTANDPMNQAIAAFFVQNPVAGNTPPVITRPADQTSNEGDFITGLQIIASDSDIGQILTYSAAGLPLGLNIDPVTGSIFGTILPNAAIGSPYTVVVTATDDGTPNLSANTNFIWTIAGSNRPPVVNDPGAQSSAEGDTVNLAISATDPDNDTLNYSAVGLPTGLSIDPTNGTISGTIAFGAISSNVIVTATDNGIPALGTSVSFNWTITTTNRQPTATNPGPQSSAEGDTVNLAISATDPDNDTLSFSATGLPTGLNIDPTSGAISGTVAFGTTTSNVTVTATDNGSPNLSVSVNFLWTITTTNRQPTATNPGPQSSAEGDTVNLAMSATDPDNDTLSFSATGLPTGLSIDPTSGAISGTVAFGATTSNVTVTATDNGTPRLNSTVSFNWTIATANQAPIIKTLPIQHAIENQLFQLLVTAVDPNGNNLTLTVSNLPSRSNFIDNRDGTGNFTWIPNSTDIGSHILRFVVQDDGTPSLYSFKDVTIIVNPTDGDTFNFDIKTLNWNREQYRLNLQGKNARPGVPVLIRDEFEKLIGETRVMQNGEFTFSEQLITGPCMVDVEIDGNHIRRIVKNPARHCSGSEVDFVIDEMKQAGSMLHVHGKEAFPLSDILIFNTFNKLLSQGRANSNGEFEFASKIEDSVCHVLIRIRDQELLQKVSNSSSVCKQALRD